MAKTKKTQSEDPQQLTMMTLNVAHLLFLHGLVKNLYGQKNIENQMSNFLHDLLIMFEIYIDSVKMDEELEKKFNYKPLKPADNEKANKGKLPKEA